MKGSNFSSWIDCGTIMNSFSYLSVLDIQYHSDCLLRRSSSLVKHLPHLDCASQSETTDDAY